jgi:ribosomal protein S6--L-glutamate ligase
MPSGRLVSSLSGTRANGWGDNFMDTAENVIALEARLRACSNVTTLGVRPDFASYSPEEAGLIRKADKIYYPSTYYADMFAAMGKKIFPSVHNYRFAQDKIKQTALFHLNQIPSPRTRVFYGRLRQEKILAEFRFPFVAKIPRGSAAGRGVFLVQDADQLAEYIALTRIAYVQEYLLVEKDIRVVVIGDQFVHAYRRIAVQGEFRGNVSFGARISFDDVPAAAVDLARHTANRCGWNDVGIDVCVSGGNFYILEANMKYGREGFRRAGIDYARLMEQMIRDGKI